MKIAIASDLHLEFGDFDIRNDQGADVLILSGDILIAQDLHNNPKDRVDSAAMSDSLGSRQAMARRFRDFLYICSKEFSEVIYVAGNHEFYNGSWPKNLEHIKEETDKFPNITFLELGNKIIDDVVFVGATLWTDMNKGDPLTISMVQQSMNDFRIVRNSDHNYRRFHPTDAAIQHKKTVAYFKKVIDEHSDKKIVVVGHHAPSRKSIKPRYQNDYHINGAYSTDLEQFILDNPTIVLWTHGHTHDDFDYQIGSTRIVCNPRGYIGIESKADKYSLKYIEI
jgi:3',5'-cyclic AMP phosphodiesterase CpdA